MLTIAILCMKWRRAVYSGERPASKQRRPVSRRRRCCADHFSNKTAISQ